MPTVPGKHFLVNLFERRSLLAQLVRRDFERRFVGSSAGWLWGLIHPLMMLGIWTLVFEYGLKQSVPEGQGTSNYTIFLFCGYLPWTLFSETVQRSASSLVENANLITKTVFPSEMIPVSIFLSSLVSHLMTRALALVAVAIWGDRWSAFPLALPFYMLLIGMFSVGLGWIVASLNVFLRDTAQVTTIVLGIWFWLTPLFMTADRIPARVRFVFLLNPLSLAVRGYRDLLLQAHPPSVSEMVWFAAFAGGVFVLGGLVFRQLKPGFADVL